MEIKGRVIAGQLLGRVVTSEISTRFKSHHLKNFFDLFYKSIDKSKNANLV